MLDREKYIESVGLKGKAKIWKITGRGEMMLRLHLENIPYVDKDEIKEPEQSPIIEPSWYLVSKQRDTELIKGLIENGFEVNLDMTKEEATKVYGAGPEIAMFYNYLIALSVLAEEKDYLDSLKKEIQ